MKKTFIIAVLVLGFISADAQVSVRRTTKKVDTQNTEVKAKPAEKRTEENRQAKPLQDPNLQPHGLVVGKTPVKKPMPERKAITTRRTSPHNVEAYSVRQQIAELNQQRDNYGSPWQHIVYRELDLNIEDNAVLHYPEVPTDGLTNFFTVVFDAFCKGQLKAYEYLDGREVFNAEHIVKVEDVLKTHDIDPADVPSYQVLSYYVKEQWEVDRTSSQYGRKVLAICPILHRTGDYGGITRYPMFWVKYDELRPIIKTQMVISSGMNTAVRRTMDDYFSMSLYKGDLYKVQNPRGLTLQQQYPDEEVRRAKVAEIEEILKNGPITSIKKESTESQK